MDKGSSWRRCQARLVVQDGRVVQNAQEHQEDPGDRVDQLHRLVRDFHCDQGIHVVQGDLWSRKVLLVQGHPFLRGYHRDQDLQLVRGCQDGQGYLERQEVQRTQGGRCFHGGRGNLEVQGYQGVQDVLRAQEDHEARQDRRDIFLKHPWPLAGWFREGLGHQGHQVGQVRHLVQVGQAAQVVHAGSGSERRTLKSTILTKTNILSATNIGRNLRQIPAA